MNRQHDQVTLCLAGDTMLGRAVAEAILREPSPRLFSRGVKEIMRSADLRILNLECCISDRGEPWSTPGKPFFFRAPPKAIDVLTDLGVDCVTLANNHALDYGHDALADTIDLLYAAGIGHVGAGRDLTEARAHHYLSHAGLKLAVAGVTDHPSDFAATAEHGGVAHAPLRAGVPEWLTDQIATCAADIVIVSPHWGPNMTTDPLEYVTSAARSLEHAGATLIAGHSAHVFQGVRSPILFDLGDFIDDYATHPLLRNDLGLLWLVTLDETGPRQIEAFPLNLRNCYTELAQGDDLRWIQHRFARACSAMGTAVEVLRDRMVITPRADADKGGGTP